MDTETPLTVGQLKERLREVPDDIPIVASYDCDCAYGFVTGCYVGQDVPTGHDPATVLLVVD